ncbi:hypothetical protein [Bacteroides intestinalis]|jgi:hypothetical protein|uniref:hypothetical protein n=1 Tax=Bacteroides intestinalis TaxID=329854 RepID=UPI000E48249D|nr:hypothetical protein [Bacteroides intestinalis]RGX86439.1 hypothetical protein DXA61_07445 [Bacteroides intestinalis]DAU57790.1 MAG TPA: hypothetical protein [Caudoviricetes sp.]
MYDFKLLKPVSNIVDVLGRVVIALALIGGLYFISSGDYNMIAGIAILLGGGILGLLLILISQLVNLFLQIEQNTRKQSEQ